MQTPSVSSAQFEGLGRVLSEKQERFGNFSSIQATNVEQVVSELDQLADKYRKRDEKTLHIATQRGWPSWASKAGSTLPLPPKKRKFGGDHDEDE